MGIVMKKLALTSVLISIPVSTLCGQSQSDIDFLRARADAHERKISELERELSQLKAFHADRSAATAAAETKAPKAVPVEEGIASASTYVVKQGDNLSGIANRNHTSVAALIRHNGLKGDTIYVGQKLGIPTGSSAAQASSSSPAKPDPAKPAQSAKHMVRSGETFFSIARQHGVSVNSLSASNPGVEPTKLRVGQQLLVHDGIQPSAASSAEKSNNKTASNTIKAPAQAASKASKAPAPKDPAPAVPSKADTDIRTITVNEQMTYGQFASRHGASTTQLNALNGLSLNKNTMLARGSELYVPKY